MSKRSRLFPKIKKLIKISVWALLIASALGLVAFAFIFKDLPRPEQFADRKISQSTKIYDRTGETLLYEIHGEEKRTVVPFNEIPDIAKQATLAAEDKDFYNHPAFDWRSITRAFFANLAKGKIVQGGSTITQQLAKNAFFSAERTYIRKIKELLVAFELEKRYSKDEILNLYLNQIPYGGNAYGIEAASQTFFNKKSKDLNLAEASILASMLQAPSYFSPWGSHLDELIARQHYVLETMESSGFITKDQGLAAEKTKLEFAPKLTSLKAPHFVLLVQEYLNNKYGENFVESAGLKVTTTLDWNLQQAAEKSVLEGATRNTELYKGHNAALVAQDATNGQILALAGSKDYFGEPEPENCTPGANCNFEGNFNVAYQGLRQPGSAMKPLVYATAFQKGYSPDTVVFDVPTEFTSDNPNCPSTVDFNNENDECFHPHNYDGIFRGPVDLRNSLAQSINVPSVKTLYLAGIDETLNNAKLFGITTLTERSRYGLSLVLGGGEVTLYDLVGAYSVFAQDGIKHQQSFILSITDSNGNSVEQYQDKTQQVIDPQYARLVNDILTDVKARSQLFQSSLSLTVFPNQEVALKTGTTNDYHDAWAMGYTPKLVVGVWAGNNDNMAMQKQGGSILAAVPIWSSFMKEALKGQSLATFQKPEAVNNQKSMLRGDYIVNFAYNNKIYPQIHNILYYVDKDNPQGPLPQNPENNPQFKNWEDSVINWAKQNVPSFNFNYNQPLPQGATESNNSVLTETLINFLSPKNGDYISSQPLNIKIEIMSRFDIKNIKIFLNGIQIDERQGSFGKNTVYQTSLYNAKLSQQNSLKIKISGDSGNQLEKEIIIFR